MANSAEVLAKRRGFRFKVDPGEYAQIDFNMEGAPFKCEIATLIFNESYRGCCLIVMKHEKLKVGSRCRVQLGPLEPMNAELKWTEEIDPAVLRIGLYFYDY